MTVVFSLRELREALETDDRDGAENGELLALVDVVEAAYAQLPAFNRTRNQERLMETLARFTDFPGAADTQEGET